MGSVTSLREQVDAEHERLDGEQGVWSDEVPEPIEGQTSLEEGEDAGGGKASSEELREEAGEPTGDVRSQMEAVREPEPDPPVEELRVDGTTQLGLFAAGGKEPTRAVLKLKAFTVRLAEGKALAKGDRIRIEGVAIVRAVGQKDKPDSKTGIVLVCEQSHEAEIVDLVVHGAEEAAL